MEEDQDREHLNKLDMYKSLGSDEMHPQALKELPDVTVRPLLITFGKKINISDLK